MTETLLVIGTVRVADGAVEAARPAMARMVAATRAEAGCLAYSYAQDMLDPGLIHVIERWRDRAALDAHFATPHMAEWRASLAGVGVTDRSLMLYRADGGEPF